MEAKFTTVLTTICIKEDEDLTFINNGRSAGSAEIEPLLSFEMCLNFQSCGKRPEGFPAK